MRGVRHHALVVTDQHIRMMILAMRNPRHGIHECHGLIIVFEGVGFADVFVLQLPAIQLPQEGIRLSAGKRRYAAFAWFALPGCQIAYGSIHACP